MTACNLPIADWLHAPGILAVRLEDWDGRPGPVIRVLANNDVLVTRVAVAITCADGTLIEPGSAVRAAGLLWEYTGTRPAGPAARVSVSAWICSGTRENGYSKAECAAAQGGSTLGAQNVESAENTKR